MAVFIQYLAVGLASLAFALVAEGKAFAASQWQVASYVLGDKPAMSKAAAEAWLGKVVEIQETSLTFDDKTCQIRPSPQEVDAADYFATQFHAQSEKLGLRDRKAVVLYTECELPGFDMLFPLADGRLMFHRDGVFFYLLQQTD